MAQLVKNLPAMQETWVRSLGQEDPLEKGMATHFSILAWGIPWLIGYCLAPYTFNKISTGNTCIPVADSFRYLAKPIQYYKV